MKLIDSHAHVFGEYLYPRIEEIKRAAQEAGVKKILAVCLNPEEAERAIIYTQKESLFDIAVGFYPNDILKVTEKDYQRLEDIVQSEKIVAVGEIGLDYFSDEVPHKLQQEAFIRQMQLAQKVQKPILVHNRLAADDTLRLMQQNAKTGGIMHCYSAGNTYLKEFEKLGMYFSFSGNITFEPDDLPTQRAICDITLDRIMIETDAPNLTPAPVYEKQNEPAYVKYVADYICEKRNIEREVLEEAVWKNYHRLFKK